MSDSEMPTAHAKPAGTDMSEIGTLEPLLRTLARRSPLLVQPATSLRDTLFLMNQADGDAVVVTDDSRRLALGIVTLRDLLHTVTFEGGGLDEAVAGYMTGAPLTVPADAPPHRAKVLMAKRGIRHLVLTEADGSLCGLVSQSDLFGLRSGGAEALVERIAEARDMQAMVRAADRVRRRAADLFAAGMGVDTLCQWMSGLNDLVAMRIIELIEDEFDLPAVPWCWMLLGSEGRLEQTFATDQDNGLVFLPPSPEATDSVRRAFLPFAEAVNKALHYCGFQLCRGNIMAGNPDWCLSEAEWRATFESWLRTPEPDALLNSSIFFDFRPLYGSFELVDRLRTWLMPQPAQYPRFLRAMTEQALTSTPSLGWAGQFVYERDKDHPHTIDLKLHGSRPFVDAARIWSLAQGVWATNTVERLRATAPALHRSPEDTAASMEAFQLVQRFRVHQQLTADDPETANRVDPRDLNELHRLMLKEAFKQAKKLQLRLKQDYSL